jgi:hypothetical protein
MVGFRVGMWVAVMLVVAAVSATPAQAGGGVAGGPGMGGHAFSPPIVPHGFFGNPNIPTPNSRHAGGVRQVFPRRHFHNNGVPFVGWGTGIYAVPYAPYYSDSGYYDSAYDSSMYASPYPMYGSPYGVTSMQAAPAPPPPPAAPVQNVVEFSSGRYELRGDGMAVPYAWVWIPNAPSAPPSGPPPPGGAPASASSGHGKLYRWTDSQGVLHVTDRWQAVPPEYRSKVKSSES